VHETVDEPENGHVSRAREVLHVAKAPENHPGVMISVKKRDLIGLLAQHKEDGVKQIHDFGCKVAESETCDDLINVRCRAPRNSDAEERRVNQEYVDDALSLPSKR